MRALPLPPGAALPAVARAVVAAALGTGMVWWSMPRLSGATWTGLGAALGEVSAAQLAELTGLWVLGLVVHSFVLTGALPGLTRRRALTLSLTGSAVANLTPVGGALGVAVNWAMARAWHVRRSTFAAYTVVTNVWDVTAKLVVPLVALVAVLGADGLTNHALRVGAVAVVAALAVVLALVTSAVASDRAAGWSAQRLSAIAHRTMRRRFPDRDAASAGILETRDTARELITGRWPQLTVGMSGYLVLQGTLLWACLNVAGATLPGYAVVAGFAVERLLTLVVLTPGGAGTADWGIVATLVAFGGDPVTVAVGALLYRGFTFLLEIPVGGIWLGGWLLTRQRHGRGET
jgi:uncharacterized protein (TIRG00374 family)